MTRIQVVTAYTTLSKYPPRPYPEVIATGQEFFSHLEFPVIQYPDYPLDQCWLYKWLVSQPEVFTNSKGDAPGKNNMDYHIVQHQKTEWMVQAGHVDADMFVWMDYGLSRITGVTPEQANEVLGRIVDDDLIHIPGFWDKHEFGLYDDIPYWRFCGGFYVCPRRYLEFFDLAVKAVTLAEILRKKNVTWEVNNWAKTELCFDLPLKWYQADTVVGEGHGPSMVLNYA